MGQITNFQNGASSFGIPLFGAGIPPMTGPAFIVGSGSMMPDYGSIGDAIGALPSTGGIILLQPGSYNETVSLVRSATNRGPVAIVGLGNPGDAAIAPTTVNAGALVNDKDDITLVNVGLAANGTGVALVNTGARLRAYGCKLENDDATGLCASMTLQTVAQRAAGTKGNGADCWLVGCEFAWAASGVQLSGTDQGSVTELQILNSWFHDMDTKHILEAIGSGGSAAVTFASLRIQGNTFGRNEAGAEPTNYIDLNADNANSGIACGNFFPTALAGGKNLVSTALIWAGNFHTGGISTAQPS